MAVDPELRDHLPLKPLEFLALAVLEEEPLHGYAMAQRIESRSEGLVRVRPGDLYRVLYRLEKRGLLKGCPAAGPGERRAYYSLTSLGRRVLRAEAKMLRTVAAGIGRRKRESHA
jgi:DNA-binding PadR family transcriptional regulator